MAKKTGQRFHHIGLLIIRVGIGTMFVLHGWPKMSGGLPVWQGLGEAMQYVGIRFAYPFWGFMAACAEFWGGIFLIAGVLFRPSCALMLITMIVAAAMHMAKGSGIMGAAHAIELGVVFLGLLFIGPGEIVAGALAKKFFKPGTAE